MTSEKKPDFSPAEEAILLAIIVLTSDAQGVSAPRANILCLCERFTVEELRAMAKVAKGTNGEWESPTG